MMEEGTLPKTEKFHKVEMKLNLLVQSKLQNLTQNGFKQAQERLNIIEKKLIEEITSNDKSTRDYRLKLRTFEEQFKEIQEKCQASIIERSARISEMKEELARFVSVEAQERIEKERWCEENCEDKMEKLEKQIVIMKEDCKYDLGSLNQRLIKTIPEEKEKIAETAKMQEVCQQCDELRELVRIKAKEGEKGQKKIIQHLKGVVGEIKGLLNEQKVEREKNRDRLINMLQQATKNIMVR